MELKSIKIREKITIASPMNEALKRRIHSVAAEEIVLWKSEWISNGCTVLNRNLDHLKSIKAA